MLNNRGIALWYESCKYTNIAGTAVRHVVPCHAMPWHAMACHGMAWYSNDESELPPWNDKRLPKQRCSPQVSNYCRYRGMACRAMPCHATPCHGMAWYTNDESELPPWNHKRLPKQRCSPQVSNSDFPLSMCCNSVRVEDPVAARHK